MTPRADAVGVIVCSFGFLRSLDDVGAYLERISGRPPAPEAVAALRARYEAMGGPGPLERNTMTQVEALRDALGPGYRVAYGGRNSEPFIPDAAAELARTGVRRIVSIALAPQYGRQSVGGYYDAVREGLARVGDPPPAAFVRCYGAHPKLVDYWADAVSRALERLPARARARAHVVFTVHSVPRRALADPPVYPYACRATADRVAEAAGIERYRLAFQSGHGDAWLGPNEEQVLEELAAGGVPAVVFAPVGFVAEHLETIYDLDIEGGEIADRLGITLERAPAPDDDPRFIAALADEVRRHAGLPVLASDRSRRRDDPGTRGGRWV